MYKDLVDDLVRRKDAVYLQRAVSQGYLNLPENVEINAFLAALNQEQKQTLITMLYQARPDGIHDTLVCIHDRMALNKLKISQDGVELPFQPFGNQLYYDWAGRVLGFPWPDEEEE